MLDQGKHLDLSQNVDFTRKNSGMIPNPKVGVMSV